MKRPNYNRKYKKRFHLLLIIGVLGTLLVLVNPLIDKISNDKEASMIEGVDFSQETMVIESKKIIKDIIPNDTIISNQVLPENKLQAAPVFLT